MFNYDPKLEKRTTKDMNKSKELPFGDVPFGNLLIIKEDHIDKRNKHWFICKCIECGKIIEDHPLRFDMIKQYGRSRYCDCKIEKPREFENLVGFRSGYLEVKEYVGKDKYNDSKWKCLCTKCNKNYSIVTRSNLLSKNNTKMCQECAYKIRQEKNTKTYITEGQIFGRLKVLEFDHEEFDSQHRVQKYYKCICDMCGTENVYSKRSLIHNTGPRCCICKNVPDLRGQKFGRLIPKLYKRNDKDEWRWVCECTCIEHNIVEVRTYNLISGNTKSCGCITIENNKLRSKHGDYNTQFYNVYRHMIDRCYNPNNESYHNYGERGIFVCDRWLGENGYINFKQDMFDLYQEGLSIDRINNDDGYYKENCRWITMADQQQNKSTNRHIIYQDTEYKCIQECINIIGFSEHDQRCLSGFVANRLNIGWSDKEAIIIPPLEGETKESWYKRHNITEQDLPDTPIIRPVYFDKNN